MTEATTTNGARPTVGAVIESSGTVEKDPFPAERRRSPSPLLLPGGKSSLSLSRPPLSAFMRCRDRLS